MLLDVFLTFVPFCQAQIQQRELLKRRRSGASRASEASSPASPVDTKQRRPSPKPSGTPEVMSATPFPMPKQEEPPMSPLCNELENRISGSDDELQMCTVADEQRTNAGYPDEKGEAAQSSKDARASSSSRGSRRDEKTEPEAEPILAHPDARRSLINEDGKEEPIRFAPHLAVLAGRVFLHYASGDCTSGTGLSSTRFRCFLRDCSILSCSSEAGEALAQRGPSSSSDAGIDRKSPAGLVVARTRSSSVTRGPRQMSRRLSGSFTAGFGTSAEAAAAENGKLPLRLCLQPVLTRAQADLLYIQAMRQQEVHMTQDSFVRALAIVGQQCLSAGVDDVEDADTDAGILNWFCQWALVPLAEALGISEHDVLCAAQILREREVSALLRSCQRGLDIVFARYAKASPAPRDPYRLGWVGSHLPVRRQKMMSVMSQGSRCCLLILALAKLDLVLGSSKRGIARTGLNPRELQALLPSVTWTYNWKLSPGPSARSSSVDFMPMVHGRQFSRSDYSAQANALLGFNEPDIDTQAHLSPGEAAAMWPEVEQMANQLGVQTLVSPAMCGDIGKGTSWMGSFLNACQNCRIDAIAIHSYWCTLDGIQNLVGNYRRFGKKIWLTEFACADPNFDVSMDGQIRFMKEVVPWLESEDLIDKYAWFSYFTNEWQYAITNPSPDAGLVHQNGDLSPLGRVYVNLGQNRRLNPVNGTSEETESAKYTETEPIFA
eukprot:symbB.v1.2.024923.t1/scaffold2393.1/size80293/2